AAQFVGDFKSLAKEADESLAKHKTLELEIKRLLRAVFSQDIMSVVQKTSVVDTSNLQTELERTKECFENCIIKKENEYAKLWNDWEEKHAPNNVRASTRTKPITVSQPPIITKKDVNSDSNEIDNTKTRRPQPRSNTKDDRVPSASKSSQSKNKGAEVIQICLWCVDLVCSKHMTGNLQLLINFVWKFMGTVRFGNDHVAAILGFGDLQWGNILITRVYFVKELGHNLFSVGQFYDSDLEVTFRRNACFIRNLEGVNLLKGDRSTNLYSINLHEMASASPICLMARASSTKSWLWHQRLSRLNFDTINDLARNDLVSCLPKFKYNKEHLCPSYEQGKSKRASHPLKPVPNSRQRLHLLHMDLCGPMRIASINGKWYALMIVDDYSRYTWKTGYLTLHVFGAICYPKNDREDIGKLGAKAMYDDYIGGQPSATARTVPPAQEPQVHQTSTASTTIADTAPTPTNSSSHATYIPITSQDVDGLNPNALFDCNTFVNPFASPSTSAAESSSSHNVDPSNMHTFYQPYPHEFQWTKDHPLEQNVKEAMTDPAWIDSMQEELLQFKRLDVGVLVPAPDNVSPLTLKWLFKNKHDEEQTSCLVMRGYYQEEGIDFKESFAPAKLTEKHLKEVKRIFRYLRGTVTIGLWYLKDSGFELTGFSDADYAGYADYAGCKDTFKSIFGGAQFLGEKLVSWSSKKQDYTTLSTAEVEYVSLSACCAQVLWMRTHLTDYGFYFKKIPIKSKI
nr:retrovirus-related Pol polyprotein from transposon TNT 1-94 [Tanacetum cinerariifolium]